MRSWRKYREERIGKGREEGGSERCPGTATKDKVMEGKVKAKAKSGKMNREGKGGEQLGVRGLSWNGYNR